MNEMNILLVEDNPGDSLLISEYLQEEFPTLLLSQAATFKEAKKALLKDDQTFDAILLDLKLPDLSEEALIIAIIPLAKEIPVIALTGFAKREFGLRTMALGMADYLMKDEINASQLSRSLMYSIERRKLDSEVKRLKLQLQRENIYLQEEIKLQNNFEEIIFTSKPFQEVLKHVEQVAHLDATVLILGETGTGKELIARAVHGLSARADRVMIKVNCGALPKELIESELFGYEKGAFTGAINEKAGRFELADGGTLFLDEIGEMPRELQVKLLRVLQDGEFERLGSTKTSKVNVRIIAATNREIIKEVESGEFREDLYYRLNVFPIQLPPLRERKEDIESLVRHFVSKYSKQYGKSIDSISKESLDYMRKYSWPGNVRELQNLVERAVIISTDGILRLQKSLVVDEKLVAIGSMELLTLEEVEKAHIENILIRCGGVISGESGAAKILEIHPNTLRDRIKKLGITPKT